MENLIKEHKIKMRKQNSNKLYHFIYTGIGDKKTPQFKTNILTILNNEKEQCFETFDCMRNEHISNLKMDLDKLHDITYFKKHGLKRKKGYLFHGLPGTGKTSTVVAMSLYDNRHIIEIPFSIIKTNEEFNMLMSLKSINDIEFNNNEIIMLFDEIDVGLKKRETPSPSPSLSSLGDIKDIIKDNTDIISIDTVLSRLDGIGNYNGLIIIATTNHIELLDPAIYREQRLTPIKFNYLRKIDVIDLLEIYFNCKLKENLIEIIPERTISPAKLIYLCDKYSNLSVEALIDDAFRG